MSDTGIAQLAHDHCDACDKLLIQAKEVAKDQSTAVYLHHSEDNWCWVMYERIE